MLHITKIKPMFTNLLVTKEVFDKDMCEGGVIVANKGDMKLWQTVLAVGPAIRDIKVGDKVMLRLDDYAVKKYSKNSLQNDMDNNPIITWNLPFETIEDDKGNSIECLYIKDRDVKFVFEGEERDDTLILPEKKKFVIS